MLLPITSIPVMKVCIPLTPLFIEPSNAIAVFRLCLFAFTVSGIRSGYRSLFYFEDCSWIISLAPDYDPGFAILEDDRVNDATDRVPLPVLQTDLLSKK